MRHEVVKLIPVTETMVFGNRVAEPRYDEAVSVYCKLKSISQTEFYNAAQAGYKLEKRADIPISDYAGQERAEIDGVEYSVVRTYENRETRNVELYLEKVEGRTQ